MCFPFKKIPMIFADLSALKSRGFKAMEEDPTLRECPECQELVKPEMLPCEVGFPGRLR